MQASTAAASLVGKQQLQSSGSVVVAHGLSCSSACEIFSDQGSNPCFLHWQADSYPPSHQGRPLSDFLMWAIFKVLTELVTILLLFYPLIFWLEGM